MDNEKPLTQAERKKDSLQFGLLALVMATVACGWSWYTHTRPAPVVAGAVYDQAADYAREDCLLSLNTRFSSPPEAPWNESDMPKRTNSGWQWSSTVYDLVNNQRVARQFTCTVSGGKVDITVAQ